MTSVAQRLARALHRSGCRHAFGVPGGEVLTLIDALAEAGIAFHLARQEGGAGFMAEGTYQVTGAPGLLVTTLGPGVTSAVNTVANAWLDRVPLIVITGCLDPAEAAGYTHQIVDHRALLSPVVKQSLRPSAENCQAEFAATIALTAEGRPGPVHIDLPVTLAGREAGDGGRGVGPAETTAAASTPICGEIARAFAEAERPLIVAGVELLYQAGAPEAVAALARRLRIPLIATYKAKGVLPEDDALAIGSMALSPRADRELLPLVAEADLVLLAGYDPVEVRAGWRDPFDPARQTVIACQAVQPDHAMHRVGHLLVGDIAGTLGALGAARERPADWAEGRPAEVRAALRAAFAAEEDWGPGALCAEAQSLLPGEAVVALDTGAHRIFLSQAWTAPAPRRLLQSTGFGTMACAVPLAAGVKLARPEVPVVAFVGDGGLEMGLGELATLRDLGLAVVVVVIVDGSLALIELKQRAAGLAKRGVALGPTDFPALARAFGGWSARARSRNEFAAAFREALAQPTFSLIAAEFALEAYEGRI